VQLGECMFLGASRMRIRHLLHSPIAPPLLVRLQHVPITRVTNKCQKMEVTAYHLIVLT
jgi:hypothetical protein